MLQSLTIDALGAQGEGVADRDGHKIFVPYTLPGEQVDAEVDGERGKLVRITAASPDRIAPVCQHFGICGGCSLQHVATEVYHAFKRDQVINALKSRGFGNDIEVAPLIPVAAGSRRRAALAATRVGQDVRLGYHIARSHTILAIEECPLLRPAIVAALPSLRALMALLLSRRGTAEVHVTETGNGLDVAITGGSAEIGTNRRASLGHWIAGIPKVVRLTVDGEQIGARSAVVVDCSGHAVALPPASFLQAVPEAEAQMIRLLRTAVAATKPKDRIADLFAGLGAFTLALAARNEVVAVEWDKASVAALSKAARQPGLRKIEVLRRDLFREPMSARELEPFAAVVFDPPRAGAQAQAAVLAASNVRTVVAVSCNPATFARDARLLVDGGYCLKRVMPIDQFLYSAHVELVAEFHRPAAHTGGQIC